MIYRRAAGSMLVVDGVEPDALTGGMLFQALAAFVGTLGFSVLFGVPGREYLRTAVVATVGWMTYLLLVRYTVLGIAASTFFATMVVVLLARLFAVWFRMPETVYLITGIFPMIPGGGIFWTTFFLVSNRLPLAMHSGMTALAVTAAIVLGIVLISSLPRKLFHR